jgi:ferrochelatase
MQIRSLADIVEGKIQNSPAISFITQIHTAVSKVNDGDAYFALESSTIQKAIEKGAFAIIYKNEQNIQDNEIAWIQVDDIQKAITNVLRYKLLQFKNQYIHTNKIFFKLLKLFKSKELHQVVALHEDISANFELLNSLEENKVIFSTDLKFLENISSEVVCLKHQKYSLKNLTQHSLFETTFSYKENFYDKIKLPRVYVDYLLQQLELFDYKLDLKKLNSFDLFKPIFINKSEQIVPFGQTNRFIIANSDPDIAQIEIEYLQTNYSYAKVQIADAKHLSDEEVLQIIQNKEFNALYFKNIRHKNILTILQDNDTDSKLL